MNHENINNGNSAWLALKMSVQVGYELTSAHPEIIEYARNKMSHRQIAEIIQIAGFRRDITSKSILEHAVEYALHGNYMKERGKIFDGLMDREEYQEIAAQNRIKSGERSSTLCRRENKGIFNLTEEEKDKARRKSSISRGEVPWESYEAEEVFRLRGQNYRYRVIADILNKNYHEGKKVRNSNSVNCMLRREKRKPFLLLGNFSENQEEKIQGKI